MVGLVPMLIKINAANSLIEDYAACLELRMEEGEAVENSCDDLGVLIMQVIFIAVLLNRISYYVQYGLALSSGFHHDCLICTPYII